MKRFLCWQEPRRRELLDRTLIWNQRHLLNALREYEVLSGYPPSAPGDRERPAAEA
jgi:hypothetical protein